MENKFHLKVVSREGVIYEEDVDSITSYNEVGKFDVLASHANFISLISKGLIIRQEPRNPLKKIDFDHALLRVRENNVEVFIGVEGMAPASLEPSKITSGDSIPIIK
ncbi:MAG: ATP synthase epsilon chain [Candidatus Woesebacteria bacterium GW2011_GWB1_39_12]|uniref:ATP synthase epsilon chain n=2 Tax=Candidatus Woeseibacteriota TaxID=1752722 RepID=A0A0G0M2Y3_9BACT|nr:MAG: ATP synthase epsilon chain [Candidatus Woesebacteria bacterium GW2011_GWA1_39_12]KKR01184.1 MAG: ATP synthase epsilon chain [Candidatus Woesebacteria bacterium GW2011_GWB1_39_12]